jgi:hypothetical protein
MPHRSHPPHYNSYTLTWVSPDTSPFPRTKSQPDYFKPDDHKSIPHKRHCSPLQWPPPSKSRNMEVHSDQDTPSNSDELEPGELTPSLSSLYDDLPPNSAVAKAFQHIQECIPNFSPLQHPSIHQVALVGYPDTVYDPRGPRSSFFWAFWSLTRPDARPVDIYEIAMQHGARVSHRVTLKKAQQTFPYRCLDKGTAPRYIRNPRFQEYFLADALPQILNENYLLAVKDLLSRENARGYIERGGLLWRIALEFGPPELWSDTFKGPSSRVVRFFEGEYICHEDDWICEEPLAREVDLLVGTIWLSSTDDKIRKSIFPPLEIFESSMHWNGVWTHQNEIWFKSLVIRLHQKQLKPKSRYHWGRWARSHIRYITNEDAEIWIDEMDNFPKDAVHTV